MCSAGTIVNAYLNEIISTKRRLDPKRKIQRFNTKVENNKEPLKTTVIIKLKPSRYSTRSWLPLRHNVQKHYLAFWALFGFSCGAALRDRAYCVK